MSEAMSLPQLSASEAFDQVLHPRGGHLLCQPVGGLALHHGPDGGAALPLDLPGGGVWGHPGPLPGGVYHDPLGRWTIGCQGCGWALQMSSEVNCKDLN